MATSSANLKAALERRDLSPSRMLFEKPRFDRYPLHPPAPLAWYYRIDQLWLGGIIAAIVFGAIAIAVSL